MKVSIKRTNYKNFPSKSYGLKQERCLLLRLVFETFVYSQKPHCQIGDEGFNRKRKSVMRILPARAAMHCVL